MIGIIGLSFQLDSINVKNLSVSTDVQTLARQIVSQCSQIQPSRLPEVEQLLLYLQTRAGDKWGEGYSCTCRQGQETSGVRGSLVPADKGRGQVG